MAAGGCPSKQDTSKEKTLESKFQSKKKKKKLYLNNQTIKISVYLKNSMTKEYCGEVNKDLGLRQQSCLA